MADQIRVLVVDDSLFLRTANKHDLSLAGFDVIQAGDGAEALAIARDACPAVIVLDLIMPKLSGIDVLHRLRQDNRTRNIPVIVMSALFERCTEELATIGVAALCEKASVNRSTLPNLVQRVIETSRAALTD